MVTAVRELTLNQAINEAIRDEMRADRMSSSSVRTSRAAPAVISTAMVGAPR